MMIDATRIFICGGSGSGKSTKAKEMTRTAKRVVAFDPMDEYEREGFTRFTTIAGLGRHIAKNLNNFRVCYVPPANGEAASLHKLSLMLRDMQAGYKQGHHKAQLHLLIEEMNMCFGSNISQSLDGFAFLCSRGRHYGINLIGISQRPNEVNTRFRGNLEHVFVFRLIDHVDIKSLASALGAEYAAKIKSLAPHDYFYRGLDGIIHKGRNRLTA